MPSSVFFPVRVLLQQPSQDCQCSIPVFSFRDAEIEHFTILINGLPKMTRLARNLHPRPFKAPL